MYNDERLLSPEGYKQMALAYKSKLSQEGFIFICLDKTKRESLAQKAFTLMQRLKKALFSLGGFLGTGQLYGLNDEHLKFLQEKFDNLIVEQTPPISRDKTRCFLSMLALENQLTITLIDLAFATDQPKEFLQMIKDRAFILSKIFKI